jgi:hypothetical protein
MPRKSPLTVVKPGDEPIQAASPMTVAEAAESGDRRALLVAMRDRIARTVANPDCPPRDLAALSRRLVELAKEIEALDLAEKQEESRRGNSGRERRRSFDASAV